MHEDDESIDSRETLFRRIANVGDTNMFLVDENTGQRVVRSGAFGMDADGCSTYLASVLYQNGLSALDVARAPQNVVVSVTAAQVRAVQFGVRPDPWPPESDGHLRDAAHALIVNPNGLGSKRLRKAFRALASEAVVELEPS